MRSEREEISRKIVREVLQCGKHPSPPGAAASRCTLRRFSGPRSRSRSRGGRLTYVRIASPEMLCQTEDEFLDALGGVSVPSVYQAGVSYRVKRVLATGGSAAAFLATRHSLDLTTPVVLKVVRPTMLEKRGATATLSAMKE